MRVDFSLEWDKAGFYSQLETDRSYTWFKLGFDAAKQAKYPTKIVADKRAIPLDVRVTPLDEHWTWTNTAERTKNQ